MSNGLKGVASSAWGFSRSSVGEAVRGTSANAGSSRYVPSWQTRRDSSTFLGTADPVRTAAVALLLTAAIAHPADTADSFDSAWLTPVCAVPFALFVGGFVLQWATGLGGPADAAFALENVAVVGVAASASERTNSLLPPALALTAFTVATDAFAVLFEAGVRP